MKRIIFAAILYLAILPCFSQDESKKLIDEDKVWEYYQYQEYDINHDPFKRISYVRYKFEGTIEKYGKLYHIWKTIDADVYTLNCIGPDGDKYPGEWEYKYESVPETIALLRECDGKVYMLLESNIFEFNPSNCNFNDISMFGPNWSVYAYTSPYEIKEGEEGLLYDFSLTSGQSYTGLLNGNILSEIEISEEEIINEQRNMYMIPELPYTIFSLEHGYLPQDLPDRIKKAYQPLHAIEGIGITCFGNLTDIWGKDSGFHYRCMAKQTYLNNVYDDEGRIIYYGWEIQPPIANLQELSTEKYSDGRIYDLFGREIRNPQPGTIYIRNGKKFIAK